MNKKILFLTLAITLLAVSLSTGQVVETKSLSKERGYEPIVIDTVGHIFEVDTFFTSSEQVKVYSYHSGTGWVPVPFQIDEADPYDTPDNDFEYNDKLLFLAQDLGDRATEDNWVDDAEARANLKRYEFEVIDSIDPEKKGWCYIYKSITLEKSNTKYLNYDPVTDIVDGEYYRFDYLKNWYPANMIITPEGGGNNTDFYERTKFRFAFAAGPIPLTILEENLVADSNPIYNANANIRLKREIKLHVVSEKDTLDTVPFTMTNYPYSSIFSGRVDTNFGFFKVLAVRMSYDLDSTAIGMKFYHGDSTGIKDANETITIDGNNGLDGVDTSLTKNKANWTMASSPTGGAGTLLTVNNVSFEPSEAMIDPYFQYLYYWDDASGNGKTLTDPRYDYDTGDSLSYGDHGMLFESDDLKGIFVYRSTSFLLPANQTAAAGQQIFYNVHSPMTRSVVIQTYSTDIAAGERNTKPYTYNLYSNYPNPFNPSTTISFEIAINENVVLEIYNIQGKHVATLVDGELAAGHHSVNWNGTDSFGTSLSSGIYVYTLKTESFNASRKMLLIK